MSIIRLIVLAAAGVLATACATEQKIHLYIAPELQESVIRFQVEALWHDRQLRIDDLIVQFGNVPSPYDGYCEHGNRSTPEVVIDADWWGSHGPVEQEMLMFHELGHCLLHLEHDNRLNADGMPVSTMYWAIFDEYYYSTFREYYLTQLFGHAKL